MLVQIHFESCTCNVLKYFTVHLILLDCIQFFYSTIIKVCCNLRLGSIVHNLAIISDLETPHRRFSVLDSFILKVLANVVLSKNNIALHCWGLAWDLQFGNLEFNIFLFALSVGMACNLSCKNSRRYINISMKYQLCAKSSQYIIIISHQLLLPWEANTVGNQLISSELQDVRS